MIYPSFIYSNTELAGNRICERPVESCDGVLFLCPEHAIEFENKSPSMKFQHIVNWMKYQRQLEEVKNV